MDVPETTYNFEVEDFHTYYVSNSDILVHNSCKHKNSSWKKQKSDYWKEHSGTPSNLYDLTDENVLLMKRGKAPYGFDGNKIELHHLDGIDNSTRIVPLTKTSHVILHKFVGFKDMVNYSFK